MSRVFDQDGNELHGLHGLAGDGSEPTLGTSAAEIIGSIPTPGIHNIFFPWMPWNPGVMQQEAQTIAPYIIAAGRNQPQVSAWEVFNAGVNDMSGAVDRAEVEISENARRAGEALFSVGKWVVIGIVGMAVLEAARAVPGQKRKGRR